MDGYTAADALATTSALRRHLGLPAERFRIEAFVGMISDEIEQLRARGHDDDAIAAMIAGATGKPLDPADLARHFVPAEERRRG